MDSSELWRAAGEKFKGVGASSGKIVALANGISA
jgi:hypothetical protein